MYASFDHGIKIKSKIDSLTFCSVKTDCDVQMCFEKSMASEGYRPGLPLHYKAGEAV